VIAVKKLLLILPLVLAISACSGYKKVVVKDIPLEQQEEIMDTYKDRSAWTRGTLEDMGEGGTIPRDTKVKIYDIGMYYNGTVTVKTLKKKNKLVHALELERPLTKEAIEEKMDVLFWFTDPTIRQVDYIRKWGKKTARAIVEHEVFVGMSSVAAIESWGYPAKVNVSEIGNKKEEQWIYPTSGNKSNYIYVVDNKVTKWTD